MFSGFDDDDDQGIPGGFNFGGGRGGRAQGSSGGGARVRRQDPPIQHTINLTLEELYTGVTKKMKISKRVATGGKQDNILTVQVKPGWKAGTKITFPKEGDQNPNTEPADIIFTIQEKPHPRFKRDGQDLIYSVHIPLVAALTGTTLKVPTIEGTTIDVPVYPIVKPGDKKRLNGYGMPNSKNPSEKGALVIEYLIDFPATIPTEAQKNMLRSALPS